VKTSLATSTKRKREAPHNTMKERMGHGLNHLGGKRKMKGVKGRKVVKVGIYDRIENQP